jgi:aminoglycoside phosphotransferase (APT) family kinase protein
MSEAATEPVLRLAPLEAYLDELGLGAGPIAAEEIGGGHSNITLLLARGEERLVLRRPPLGPLAPSSNDVVREARLLRAVAAAGLRVPEVLEICEDPELIGAPFYLMPFLPGHVLAARVPDEIGGTAAAEKICEELVRALVELHAIDPESAGLSGFGRPSGYLERQLKRFGGLLEHNATRPLPGLERVGEWLGANQPESPPSTLVHGDYRLGNMMFAASEPRLTAILDWEMGTLGDPLADVGYMTATWAERDNPSDPMLDLSAVTRLPGFPTRAELARAYAEASGRSLEAIAWYQVLALWKAAIFLEGSYGRYRAGASADPYFARLELGVPELGRRAQRLTEGGER